MPRMDTDELEDVLAQAIVAREIHIPPALGAVMPDLYRIIHALLQDLNKQPEVPLQSRFLPEDR